MRRLDVIWHFGTSFTDLTAALGIGSSISLAPGETLYCGYRDWLAGLLIFVPSGPAIAGIITETFDGQSSEWRELPQQERFDQLASGHVLDTTAFDFKAPGAIYWGESPWLWTLRRSVSNSFPESSGSVPSEQELYWVRLRNTGTQTVTINRVLPMAYNTYASHHDIARFLGLPEFDDISDPLVSLVRKRIRAAEDWIDQYTRRSWRPRAHFNERHNFNPYGMRLKFAPIYFVTRVGLWQGSSIVDMTEGRNKEWFITPETGMLRFTLPSFRLRYYSFLLSRYLRQPDSVEVDYVAGEDFDTSATGQLVQDIVLRRVGADLVRQMDWTAVMVNNPDAVPKVEKARQWDEQAEALADTLRSPLVV